MLTRGFDRRLFCQHARRSSCRRRLMRDASALAVAEQADAESTQLEYGLARAQGPREGMEDTICIIEDLGGALYAGVFDGHGGDVVSIWLEENLHTYIQQALKNDKAPDAALQDAFKAADEDLLKHLQSPELLEEPIVGSTATVVLASMDKLVVASIGDSSAFLVRYGKPQLLSSAHRVYGSHDSAKAETERVTACGGWVVDGRVCDVLAVSRAFGDRAFKGEEGLPILLSEGVKQEWWDSTFAERKLADVSHFACDPVSALPEISVTTVGPEQEDEFFVVASDGLWDFYSQSEALSFARHALKQGRSCQGVADELVERAMKRKTEDNVAVAVVKYPWFRAAQDKPAPAKRKSGLMSLFG